MASFEIFGYVLQNKNNSSNIGLLIDENICFDKTKVADTFNNFFYYHCIQPCSYTSGKQEITALNTSANITIT